VTNKNFLSPEYIDSARRLLLNVDRLPTISTTFEKLIELMDDDSSSVHELEKIIQLDMVVSTRILKLVNSPFYGYSGITSISHAITLLGFNTLRNLALSALLSNVFNAEQSIGEVSASDFWLHSIGVAHISKLLAMRTNHGEPEEIFTLGLLHDIGKLLYFKETPELFLAMLERTGKTKEALNHVENELGVSHAYLGWFLCEKWNFPSKITSVIKDHHRLSGDNQFPEEVAIVNLADYIVHRLDIGKSGNTYPDAPGSAVSQRLKLSKQAWSRIRDNLSTQKDAIVKVSQQLLKK
jgi:putative nucleotidyltransferase with HDIG domain